MKITGGRRPRRLALAGALWVVIAVFFSGQAASCYAEEVTICFVVDDGSGVGSNPTNPTTFTIFYPEQITYFQTLHVNDGNTNGGSVGLRSSDGLTYGPWPVTAAPSLDVVIWVAYPNVTIPPGTYTVTDSNPATWACNPQSLAMGFTVINAIMGETRQIELELLYPVGGSPKVFTQGWLFGARCVDLQTNQDLSDRVQWSGTGSFLPSTGSQSRPTFGNPGLNTITLTFTDGPLTVSKDFTVEAVSPKNYARVGSLGYCPADTHGAPCCPHNVKGPVISGSPTVFIDGFPAARVGDPGTHALCCGPNTFVIAEGDPEVLIDGRQAARIGDKTIHCGGVGKLINRPYITSVHQLLLGD